MLKPGYKTTEFWMTFANTVLMVLVAAGVLAEEEAQSIAKIIAPFVAALLPVLAYIWSRTHVKTNGGN